MAASLHQAETPGNQGHLATGIRDTVPLVFASTNIHIQLRANSHVRPEDFEVVTRGNVGILL